MTREEAITELEEQASMYSWQSEDINKVVYPKRYEEYQRTINAITLAIEMLNQQPCEDCISRERTMLRVREFIENTTYTEKMLVDDLNALPPVTPQQKIGRWIEGKYRDDDIRYNDSSYKCNKCGRIVDFKENYCPDCGHKMIQEVEE